jgi:flagellar biosynthesis/type III secretory pathway protein FliH
MIEKLQELANAANYPAQKEVLEWAVGEIDDKISPCWICEMQSLIDEMPDNIDLILGDFLLSCKKGQREHLKPIMQQAFQRGRKIGFKEGRKLAEQERLNITDPFNNLPNPDFKIT